MFKAAEGMNTVSGEGKVDHLPQKTICGQKPPFLGSSLNNPVIIRTPSACFSVLNCTFQ